MSTDSISGEDHFPPLTSAQLLAFFAMVVGMFMAVLDIQIVASSISVIGAGLSASGDELSWVQTSYMIAEVIIIPITGFLAKSLSTRIAYFIAALGFTIMSILCSIAWNIESMIIFRALQGLFGGAMIPTVFATIYMIFPPKQRPQATITVGLVVTLAPTLGPTIGGYVTEILSWHFMFLLNIIPGFFVCLAVYLFADFDKPNHALFNNFDYLGVLIMSVTLGCLQYTLEEGTSLDWFESTKIIALSMIVTIGFIVLIWHELQHSHPILDLAALSDPNFMVGCIYSFVIGIGLFGVVYLLPLFLYPIAGLTTFQIGLVMMVTGLAQFVSAPVAGNLYNTGIDPRVMLGGGLALFALGCYTNSFLTPDARFWEFFIPQAIRGFSLMFCFIPINDLALGGLPKNRVQDASGLYNLMRNLGGAIGLATINTYIIDNAKINSAILGERIVNISPLTQSTLQQMNSLMFDKIEDSHRLANLAQEDNIFSYFLIKQILHRDSYVIAINDIFSVLTIMFLASILLLPFTKKVDVMGDNAGH